MKTFILRILKFGLPLIIIFITVSLFLRLTGENYYSIDGIIKSDKKYLVGYAYNEENYKYLKWKSIIEKDKRKIWALGSSRVLQLRAKMFESSFYNAGHTISNMADFIPFLKSIPREKYPDVLIIGLDQWMFNKNWNDLNKARSENYWKESFSYNTSRNAVVSITKDMLKKKYGVSIINQRFDSEKGITKIGLNALVNNKGFRNDGSIYYGSQIEMLLEDDTLANDYNYSDTYDRIKNGNRRFQYGREISEDVLVKLEELLQFCRENQIYVIGFIPPFANKVSEKITETGKYKYVKSIHPNAKKYFKKYGFELWDLQNLAKYNSDDNETLDGFHGGELTYLKMLIYMIKNNSELIKHTDLERLEKDIVRPKNRYLVYEY